MRAPWAALQAMKAMSGEWVELDNGCLCCSVKNDFVQALESLMRKKQKPQCIVIETTGALPRAHTGCKPCTAEVDCWAAWVVRAAIEECKQRLFYEGGAYDHLGRWCWDTQWPLEATQRPQATPGGGASRLSQRCICGIGPRP